MTAQTQSELNQDSEYEIKFNMANSGELTKLFDIMVHRGMSFRPFAEADLKPYYRHDHARRVILSKTPSWYVDTEDLTLYNHEYSIRDRLTPWMPNFRQLAIKGPRQKFNGPGGAERLEIEEQITRSEIPEKIWRNKNAQEVMDLIAGRPLYYHHATMVDRQIIGIKGHTVGSNKKALFEVSGDDMTFVMPTASYPLKFGSINPWQIEYRPYGHMSQVEIEFMNPLNQPQKLRTLMQSWGFGAVYKEELEIMHHHTGEAVQDVSTTNGLSAKPETRSKGQIGFATHPSMQLALA